MSYSSIFFSTGSAEHLKTRTVLERLRKGQNATAAKTTENCTFSLKYNSLELGSTTAFQRLDQVNMHHITAKTGLEREGDTIFGGYTYQQRAS